MATPVEEPKEISEEVFNGPAPLETVYVCIYIDAEVSHHVMSKQTVNALP